MGPFLEKASPLGQLLEHLDPVRLFPCRLHPKVLAERWVEAIEEGPSSWAQGQMVSCPLLQLLPPCAALPGAIGEVHGHCGEDHIPPQAHSLDCQGN
eukprot:8456955-Lingulodinium_polyedra.AAC.1